MTKEAALYHFWSSFSLPAYEESSVYADTDDMPQYPYITYEVQTDDFFGSPVYLTASAWYSSTSWTDANAKKREVSEKIGMGGIMLDCDGGHIWIRRGSPFASNMADDTDKDVKRISFNIIAEFFTEN